MGCSSENTSTRIPPGTTLEIYTIAAPKAPNTTEAIDPITGGPLYLQSPSILATTDIATVARSEIEAHTEHGAPSESTLSALDVALTPAGSDKMAAAIATHIGERIAVVIDGQLVCTPRLVSPIKGSFQISGNDVRFTSAIEALTKP